LIHIPAEVQVFEVGPRDGLQNEPLPVPSEVKVQFIDLLSAAALPYIEVSSFVDPRWIPQLGDALRVFGSIQRRPGTRYAGLVPNLRGLERAQEAKPDTLAVFVSASNTHNQRNLNRTIDESLQNIADVLLAVRGQGCWIRGYVSMVWGCPYEGEVTSQAVGRVAASLLKLGVDQVSLGDTVGYATPRDVQRLLTDLRQDLPLDRVALHFHDTRGTALANVVGGLDAGVRVFDGSAGGLGGCPYAPGASGNLATEDLVQMLHAMGVETGVDLDALLDAAAFIESRLQKRLPGRYLRAARGSEPCWTPNDTTPLKSGPSTDRTR
jgi:hydroxymethylglutaryl-CoA lyase